jgi:hypothetical protein
VTGDGFLSLVDCEFTRTGAEKETAIAASAYEFDELLRRHFNLVLAEEDIARLGLFA